MARPLPQPRFAEESSGPQLRVISGFGGGPPALAPQPLVNSAQLAILIFIAFETMMFAGLVTAFFVLRSGSFAWPPPGLPRLPLEITAVNTLVLTLSAFTMWRALANVRASNRSAARGSLLATTVLGVGFLAVQGTEWSRLIRHGLTLSSGSYGSIFYTLIGLHALHVVSAVIWLLVVFANAERRGYAARGQLSVQLCATYWYFVCALWLVLFGTVYLT
jgi:cytochrome c oxidase subunit 3